jgi:hypothetical protein
MEWSELGGAHAAALALGVLSSVLFLWLIGSRSGRARTPEPQPVQTDTAELHAALVQIQDEFRQCVGELSGRLDAKMNALRRLLHDARSAIDELRQLTDRPARPLSVVPAVRALDGERVAGPPAGWSRFESPAHNATKATGKPGVDHAGPDPRNTRHLRIYSLADEGLDPAGIASETGIQRGEVELILSLRRKQQRVARGSRTEPARVVDSSEEALV